MYSYVLFICWSTFYSSLLSRVGPASVLPSRVRPSVRYACVRPSSICPSLPSNRPAFIQPPAVLPLFAVAPEQRCVWGGGGGGGGGGGWGGARGGGGGGKGQIEYDRTFVREYASTGAIHSRYLTPIDNSQTRSQTRPITSVHQKSPNSHTIQ